jgi:hypothetical protein
MTPQQKFYKNNKELCHARTKAWREKNPGYSTLYYHRNGDKSRSQDRERSKTKEGRLRNKAKQAVLRAVRSGDLVKPSVCPECGQSKAIHGHHPDYDKPLAVLWLCRDCHVELHVTKRKNTT